MVARQAIVAAFPVYIILQCVHVEILAHTIRDYWQCEATGVDPENSCNRLKASFEKLANPGLTAFSFVLMGIFPAVNAVNISELKQKLKTCCE